MASSENGVGDVVNIRAVTCGARLSSACETETTVVDSFLNCGPPRALVNKSVGRNSYRGNDLQSDELASIMTANFDMLV